MASAIIWSGGLAGSGIDTATTTPVIASAPVIWLDYSNGDDSNAGTNPEIPVKTFAQAVANASSSSIISVVAGNNEPITGTVAINKSVKVVGSGIGSSMASFAPVSGGTLMFNVTADDVTFEGIYFRAALATYGTAGKVSSANKGLEFYSCQIDMGFYDGIGVILAASSDYSRFDGCLFTLVAPTSAANVGAICINSTATSISTKIFDTTFAGNGFGKGGSAVTFTGATRWYIKNVTLTGRADISGTGTSYNIIGVTTSGASRIVIT